ncbi:hypothetical protein FACS189465_0550 [Clostridia bacterium]|nr:hypothetical protein FACS189465_0550 [Clostridia bacterium]
MGKRKNHENQLQSESKNGASKLKEINRCAEKKKYGTEEKTFAYDGFDSICGGVDDSGQIEGFEDICSNVNPNSNSLDLYNDDDDLDLFYQNCDSSSNRSGNFEKKRKSRKFKLKQSN